MAETLGPACYELAIRTIFSSDTDDVRRAGLELLSRSCDADYARGCVALANELQLSPRSEDSAEAMMWLKVACQLDTRECAHLAGHLAGDLRIRDMDRAIELYVAACNAGNGEACTSAAYATALYQGHKRRAAELMRRGCALGDSLACDR